MHPNYKLRSEICYVIIVILLFISGGLYGKTLTLNNNLSELQNKTDELTHDETSPMDPDFAYENGLIDGKAISYDEGFAEGYESGFMDGVEAGYEDGYSDGSTNKFEALSSMDKYKFLYRNGFLDGLVHGINPDTKPTGNIGSIKTFEEEYETIRYVDEYLKDYDISSDLFEFTQLHQFK